MVPVRPDIVVFKQIQMYGILHEIITNSDFQPCGSSEKTLTSSVDTQQLSEMKDVDMLPFINTYDQSMKHLKKVTRAFH